ncbi:hypothetical protein LR48_Vigan04g158600 [Vigna angularis]|uniref:Uncharacterized protein n=1 Tax=Phaseolus angularis TaxID=3914 RepID=A0A0L9UF70_PHAAN|nr:hypothetical protein LR48_Vigan04g158600 [Vigna angularis]
MQCLDLLQTPKALHFNSPRILQQPYTPPDATPNIPLESISSKTCDPRPPCTSAVPNFTLSRIWQQEVHSTRISGSLESMALPFKRKKDLSTPLLMLSERI